MEKKSVLIKLMKYNVIHSQKYVYWSASFFFQVMIFSGLI